jgi:uncharacterized membrane protein
MKIKKALAIVLLILVLIAFLLSQTLMDYLINTILGIFAILGIIEE